MAWTEPHKEPERHPMMLFFTWLTFAAGATTTVLTLQYAFGSSYGKSVGSIVGASGAAVAGGLLAWAAIHFLRRSNGFKDWSKLTPGERGAAQLVMVPGALVGCLIVIVPFMMYAAAKANSRS